MMGEAHQLRLENLGDFDPSCKSSRQLRDELRDATRSLFRREKGDLFNFKSVRLAEEEIVVLDLPGIQKPGARGNKPEPSADSPQDDNTEADRKAMLKLAKKLVKAKQPRESDPSSDSDEDELQAEKASCSASSSSKTAKPQLDPNGGKHTLSQQDLRHQRRIITPQALQQWWLERVQLSEGSEAPPKGPTGLSTTSFKQQLSRGSRQQLQPDIQRVAAMKKSVTMTFSAPANSSSNDPEATGGSCQSEKPRFDPRMKRIVSGGRLKYGSEPGGASGRMGDIFEERYSRRSQNSPGSALEANIHALGKQGLGGTFEVQGRTFEVASRANNQSQKLSMVMTGRNGAQPTGPPDPRSAQTSRESAAGGAKVMNDSMDARQPTLQLPPVPGAKPSGPAAVQAPQGDGTPTNDYSVSGQTNSSKAIQSMHQMQREFSRKKPLLHKPRHGGAGQRPLMMQGAV